ncbi:MAG: PKD domain-containing protein, partial [Chitinophagales bacterium]|nr:PKD domain-containing protein [Chitinophagales bacterium]
DSLSVQASLGNDTTLCAGNRLGLVKGMRPGLNYQWNNGSSSPFIYVTAAGDYSVTVQNALGCVLVDTVSINLRGIAPTAAFKADSVCHNQATTFTNLSSAVSPDYIVQYYWDFGNNSFSNDTNPSFTFPNPGDYPVKLTVLSADTCSNDTIVNVKVFANPVAFFDKDTVCVGNSVVYKDLSTISDSQLLDSWIWDFGNGDKAFVQNPVYVYNSSGQYVVSLQVGTNRGCKDTFGLNLTVLPGAPAPQPFSSYLPVDSFNTLSPLVDFRWNPSVNASYYRLQISNDINFSSNKIDTLTYNTQIRLEVKPSDSIYYWRVLAYNVCESFVSSNRNVLTVSNFMAGGKVLVWLRTDSLVNLSGGNVVSWGDVSGNGYVASQPVAAKRPTLTTPINLLNNYRALQFNGAQFLRLNATTQNQPLALFAVWNTTGTTSFNTLIEGTTANNRYILRHSGGTINAFAGNNLIEYPKVAPFNFVLNSVIFNGANSQLYESGIRRAIGNAGTNVFSGLTIGARYDSLASYFLLGRVAEIIILRNTIDSITRTQVEGYLRHKYAPPVNLGPDISFAYGACDTTLRIRPGYTRVLWSTGDTGVFAIKVRRSGKYWVRATDVFGFVSSDTVNVSVPYSGIKPAKDTIICAGTTAELSFGIQGAPYFFEWSTGDTGVNFITVSQPGAYFVRVRDTIGCTLTSDTIRVSVDSLEYFSVLNDDTITCTNTPLALNPFIYPYKNFQWSTGGNKDTIMVAGPGKVYVTVTDVNGCSTRDSINVKVKGVAPAVSFSFRNLCFGDTTEFTDLTTVTPPEQLAQWIWNLGNSDTSYEQNPKKYFPFVGNFNVSLTAITDSGCFATATRTVSIGSRPNPLVSYNISCANTSTLISDLSTIIAGDTIKNWLWILPDGRTFTSKNINVKFDSAGVYPVKLIVTSAKGCTDSVRTNIEVFPAIRSDFVYDNQCEDRPTTFTDITSSFSIISREWKLGNTPGVIKDSIRFSKTFYEADTFDVMLQVVNAIGCRDTVVKQVVIYPNPAVSIIDTAGCVGSSVTLRAITSTPDSIVRYEWKFGSKLSKSVNPTFALPDTGIVPLTLKVTTLRGCIDSTATKFTVLPIPKANFSFEPFFGEAPFAVNFTNQSSNASSFQWDFGNGQTSIVPNPATLYSYNDTFEVKLKAFNELGCADSVSKKILVIPTEADIELLNLSVQKNPLANGFTALIVTARFANVGTQPIVKARFIASLEKYNTLIEEWNGILLPGEVLNYTFKASFYLSPNASQDYVCVDAIDINDGVEKNLANNRNCRSVDNQVVVTKLYPNPAVGKIYLDIISPEEVDFDFEISNQLGQKLFGNSTFRAQRGYNQVELDVRSLMPGIYLLKATYRDNVIIQKFKLQR